MQRPERYTAIARCYDALSGEWPVYGAGRKRLLADLGLRRGDTVLDIGCGTGLNFSHVLSQIGPEGHIVGLDASAGMLQQARRRADRRHWANITLIEGDATILSVGTLRNRLDGLPTPGGPKVDPANVDAVIATYSLSLMTDWRRAWQTATEIASPTARLGIVDTKRPTGRYRWLTPLALMVCGLGGSDIDAHPWTVLDGSPQLSTATVRGGHIEIHTATRRHS